MPDPMSIRRSGKSPASVHAALALLTAAYVLSYVDRTIIALMVGPIRADLGLTDAYFGVADKLALASTLLAERGMTWAELAVIGDDWPDLPLMQRAALACAPPNAHIEVRAVAHHVTQAAGGAGAVRELCDLLLVASGRYAGLLRESLA